MKNILLKTFNNEILSNDDIEKVIRWTVQKIVPPSVVGAMIYGFTKKGLNVDEMTALTLAMRNYAIKIEINENIVDSCGTGADNSQTFNISTAAAIVAAAAGAKVIKQTNSSITSRSGSSDFLSALKIPFCKTSDEVMQQFAANNIAFVHSPSFNKGACALNPIRQELGIRSIFNFVGPMINPSFPNAQLIGVCDHKIIDTMIKVLQNIGVKRAMVVHGISPSIDEISVCSETHVFELKDEQIFEYYLKPQDFGIKQSDLNSILGATPLYNANLVIDIFNNKLKGAKVDVIALNAGAMLYLNGVCKSISDGIVVAYSTINNGLAYEKLKSIQTYAFNTKH